jgi:DNA-binding NarL/FixJ family response regulator
LFAEGMAARLSQLLSQPLTVVDARSPQALQQVIARRPAVVILDAADEDVDRLCPLSGLLNALPAVKIVRLHVQDDQIQVITSQRHTPGRVQDLVTLIQSEAE